MNEETLAEMQSKHPRAELPLPSSIPKKDRPEIPPDTFSNRALKKLLKSFSLGTSGGASGLTIQHLRDIVERAACGTESLQAIRTMCLIFVNARMPESAASNFAGARLIALFKKTDGLRPIAMGDVFRRITCRYPPLR